VPVSSTAKITPAKICRAFTLTETHEIRARYTDSP
jgi:hypothetical protein